jgi:fumarate hydratase class II
MATALSYSRIERARRNESVQHYGYASGGAEHDKASAIAHKANDEGLSLREAALKLGYIDAARFDEIVDPKRMVGHGVARA